MKRKKILFLISLGIFFIPSISFAETKEWIANGSTTHLYSFNQLNPPTTVTDFLNTANLNIDSGATFSIGYIGNGGKGTDGNGGNGFKYSSVLGGTTYVWSSYFLNTPTSTKVILNYSTASTGGAPNGQHIYIQRNSSGTIQMCNGASCAGMATTYQSEKWYHFILIDSGGYTLYSSIGDSVSLGTVGVLQACTGFALNGSCESLNGGNIIYDQFFTQSSAWTTAERNNYFENYTGGLGEESLLTGALQITFPTNNSIVPDFFAWQIERTNLVEYGDLSVEFKLNTETTNQTFIDQKIGFAPLVSANPYPLHKNFPLDLINSYSPCCTTSTPWTAQPFYRARGQILSGNIINFRVDRNVAFPTGTVSFPFNPQYFGMSTTSYALFFSTSTPFQGSICPDATGLFFNWEHITRGLCLGTRLLFSPSEFSNDLFQQNLSAFKNSPPFSVVFQNFETVISALQQTNSSTQVFNLSFSIPIISSATIPILNSSTLEKVLGKETKDLVFTYMKTFIWLTFGIAATMIIF